MIGSYYCCMSEEFARLFVRKADYDVLVRRFGDGSARVPKGVLVQNVLGRVDELERQVVDYREFVQVVGAGDVSDAKDKLSALKDLEEAVFELRVSLGL